MFRLRHPRSVLALLTTTLCLPLATGCATKSYVRDRVAELNSSVDSQNQGLRSDLDRTGRRVSDLSDQTQSAAATASSARDLALGNVDYHNAGTYEVHFAFDSVKLTPAAQQTLDQAVSALKDNPRYLADIVGNADTVGPQAYNDELSRRRASTVLQYLVQHGPGPVGRYAIVGMGEAEPVLVAGKEDHTASRRVEVSLLQRIAPGTESAADNAATQVSLSDLPARETAATPQPKKPTQMQRADLNTVPR